MAENGNGLTAARMVQAIEDSRGFISEACKLLGCSRSHFYNKLKTFPTAQQALDDVREKRHDYVESKMMKRIEQGDTTMIIFYLKTQCKARGYVERQEVTGADGGPVTLAIVEQIVDAGPADG
jgi:hypothetical protein